MKSLILKNVFLRKDDNENWECITEKEYDGEEDQEGYAKETLEYARPSWALAAHVDRVSSDVNMVGVRTTSIDIAIEQTVRFYLKKTSFMELDLINDEGFEKISDDQWEKIIGEDGLPPTIIIGIYRAYREISNI